MASNSQLLLMAGLDVNNLPTLQMYDINDDKWYPEIIIPKDKIQESVSGFFGVVGSKVYFSCYAQNAEEDWKIVYNYDFLTKEVHSVARVDANISGGVIMDDKWLYCVDEKSRLHRTDIAAKKSEFIVQLPKAFYSFEVVNGLICLVTADSQKENSRLPLKKNLSYNPATNELKEIPPVPVILDETSPQPWFWSCEFENKLYTINTITLAHLYAFSTDTGEWSTIDIDSPPVFEHGFIIACNGRLIAVSEQNSMYVYDSQKNQWDAKADYSGALVFPDAGYKIEKSNAGIV